MAKEPDVASSLKRVPRFADLSKRDLKAMADAGTYLHLPANWTLMAESTPADKAYVLLAGEVDIRRKGETIATVGPGGVIGEVGIMENRLRTASVVSTSELEVVHFTNDDLARLADEIPAVGSALRATAESHLAED